LSSVLSIFVRAHTICSRSVSPHTGSHSQLNWAILLYDVIHDGEKTE